MDALSYLSMLISIGLGLVGFFAFAGCITVLFLRLNGLVDAPALPI